MTEERYTADVRARVEAMAVILHDVMPIGDSSTAFGVLNPPRSSESDDGPLGVMWICRRSPNDLLWTQRALLGWASEDEKSTEHLPMREKVVGYGLIEHGKPMLAQFLQGVA